MNGMMKKTVAVAILLAGASFTSSAHAASCKDLLRDLQTGPRLPQQAISEAREADRQLNQKGDEGRCKEHAENALRIRDQQARNYDRRYDDRYDRRRDDRYDDRYDRRGNDRYDDRYGGRYDDRGSSGSSSNPIGNLLDQLGGNRR